MHETIYYKWLTKKLTTLKSNKINYDIGTTEVNNLTNKKVFPKVCISRRRKKVDN